jgi:hypothetical protein
VSKRRHSPYPFGRGKEWLKTKYVFSDEFVIIGYRPLRTEKGGPGGVRQRCSAAGIVMYAEPRSTAQPGGTSWTPSSMLWFPSSGSS